MEVYDLVGCVDGGFSPDGRRELPECPDIGKEKFRACRLPCENGRVGRMKTTLQNTVSAMPADAVAGSKPARIEDRLREAIRERHYSLRTEAA